MKQQLKIYKYPDVKKWCIFPFILRKILDWQLHGNNYGVYGSMKGKCIFFSFVTIYISYWIDFKKYNKFTYWWNDNK